jgi:FdhD protein
VIRPGSTSQTYIYEVEADRVKRRRDTLVVEEPLEIRVIAHAGDRKATHPVAVTMRTPGHDFELAAGFLFSEGLLRRADDLQFIRYCVDDEVDGEQQYNIVTVELKPGVVFDMDSLKRNFYATSSCGVCGKATLEAVRVQGAQAIRGEHVVSRAVLQSLPDKLRDAQRVFDRTGGLHAAALFDMQGGLIEVREDIGRHNALDKLIGNRFLADRLPLSESVLLLSGRAGFEMVQKAAMAGAPIVASVSAPSSLAVDLAGQFDMTLVGFLRGARFNIYSGRQRIQT